LFPPCLYDLAELYVLLHEVPDQGCRAKKKGVGTHSKIAISKQLQTLFKAKR